MAVLFVERAAQPQGAPASLLVLPGNRRLLGAYLEGDVILSRGERVIRGARLYYDFINQRAIILDAVLHSVQEERNIPIYVRASEIRQPQPAGVPLRPRQGLHQRVQHAVVLHRRHQRLLHGHHPRDEKGVAVGETGAVVKAYNATYNLEGVPFFYWPYAEADLQTGDTPLRRVQVGRDGRLGFGVQTQWALFRLLGLVEPEGFQSRLAADAYSKGAALGINSEYQRESFAGYVLANAVRDGRGEDNFGLDRQDIPAPNDRGRFLWRHKQYLPNDVELQLELSYICDRNFLEQFYRDEFWTGKDQDTLVYAKKQTDTWALTGLVQGQINRFQTGQEAAPDLGFWMLGQPLAGGAADYYSDSHLGLLKYKAGHGTGNPQSGSDVRADTRQEADAPLHLGALSLVPYLTGRASFYGDGTQDDDVDRWFGGGGVKANLHVWRVYNDAQSRALDVNRLKHVLTPELVGFGQATNVQPNELYPFSPDIEQHVEQFQGGAVGLRQLWQTYRGHPGQQQVVDLARLNLWGMAYNDSHVTQKSDGRFFWDRPEYSIARNAINGDFLWNMSDATRLSGDMNYDTDSEHVGIADVGVSVQRDPRLRYYVGQRYIRDMDKLRGHAGLELQDQREVPGQRLPAIRLRLPRRRRAGHGDHRHPQVPPLVHGPQPDRRPLHQHRGRHVHHLARRRPEFRLGTSRMGTQAFSSLN